MNIVYSSFLKPAIIVGLSVSMNLSPALASGFLDKLKAVEKLADTVTKPPKVQADVGGVKIDATSCRASTGVKTIDNATKDKTKDICGTKKETEKPAIKAEKPAEITTVSDTDYNTDNDVDR